MKTIILAGGLGTRISEETHLKPKPMIEIGGMPVLWHIMKIYEHYGHNDFLIALGYKGEVIKNFFLDYRSNKNDFTIDLISGKVSFEDVITEKWNVGLHDTGSTSMTGGRLLALKRFIKLGDTFFLTYGDGVSDLNLNELLNYHKSHGKIATLTAVRPPARFGSLLLDNIGKVKEFKEKPQLGEGWINGGFFVFNYEIFDYLKDSSTILEKEPLESLSRNGELMAYMHDGFWHSMDTIRDRDNLNEIWKNGNALWKKWQ